MSNGGVHTRHRQSVYNGQVKCGVMKCKCVNSIENGEVFDGDWVLLLKRHTSLVLCVLLATAATFSKETGITALAACAVYDIIRAAQDATWNNKVCIYYFFILN